MNFVSNISKNDIVKGVSKGYGIWWMSIEKASQNIFKDKNHFSSLKPFQLPHMDLFGPLKYASIGGKYCAFLIVDDE